MPIYIMILGAHLSVRVTVLSFVVLGPIYLIFGEDVQLIPRCNPIYFWLSQIILKHGRDIYYDKILDWFDNEPYWPFHGP